MNKIISKLISAIKYIYEKLWCILAVGYWGKFYSEYPYNEDYDKWCREVLRYAKDNPSESVFTDICDQTANFGVINDDNKKLTPKVVWVANIPYASFRLYRSYSGIKQSYSPSRYTKYLMNKQLKRDIRKFTSKEFQI